MTQTQKILFKHLTNHFEEGAEVYIKDHPALVDWLHNSMKETATEFAKWLNREGWREYDQENNWICPSNSNALYTTNQLFLAFNDGTSLK